MLYVVVLGQNWQKFIDKTYQKLAIKTLQNLEVVKLLNKVTEMYWT